MTAVAVVGVDPGASGALVALDGAGGIVGWRDMPLLLSRVGKHTRRVVDAARVTQILEAWEPGIVVIEAQGPRPTDTPLGAFATGRSYGALLAACEIAELPRRTVPPATWKAGAGLSADKGRSVEVAERRWPGVSAFRGPRGGGRDGRAEAALLAVWWLETGGVR